MAITDLNLNIEESEGIKRKYDTSRIYFAEVMDTRDPLHAGRLKVWIVSSGTDKTDRDNWVIARHSSSFYGTTPIQNNGTKNSPASYGSVNALPYPGTMVAICFPPVVGENVMPYWFSCPVDDVMNRMAAGLGGNPPYKEIDPIALDEKNQKETNATSSSNKDLIPEKVDPLIEGVTGQGLEKDKLRGFASNTPNRGDFPTSYSFTTPLGNTLTMDDGWAVADPIGNWDTKPEKNEIKVNGVQHELNDWNGNMTQPNNNTRFNAGIRLRTRSGTQVLISDNGNVYAINKNGTAWLELSQDGFIDAWAEGGINFSANGDLNIHSGGNINIESGKQLNISSSEICISTSKVNLDAQSMDVAGEIRSSSIQCQKGVMDMFTSSNIQGNGTFQGTFNGMASISSLCTFVPTTLPTPMLVNAEPTLITAPELQLVDGQLSKDDKNMMDYSICSRVPTGEPYAAHNVNEKFDEFEKKKEEELKKAEKEQNNGVVNQ